MSAANCTGTRAGRACNTLRSELCQAVRSGDGLAVRSGAKCRAIADSHDLVIANCGRNPGQARFGERELWLSHTAARYEARHFVGRVALDPPMRGLAGSPEIGSVGASVWQVGADLPYVPRGIGGRVRAASSARRGNL
jgi:hypothetical protein